ncbi:MAG TPA: bacteriohopanetetrol glucosamine biosynthesis glycosyltransferase HpnI, partial [Rhodopila sp.]|nr:bacteriohopanetetrol glucosamine biosynthesis glycosyltransferase HpnI [Rhodopila sp.]
VMSLIVNRARHGTNGKVSNLINMFAVARHDVIVIADSDVHAAPDYLERLVAALEQPGVGLVTTLYAGLPATRTWPAQLGTMQITYGFLPSAVLARALGRRDCLGATMCLRRTDLQRIGGLAALANHLADDQVLGRRIVALGMDVALAQTVVLTTVPESRLRDLFMHELRWARTIRTLEPVGFAASVLQYPLAWSLLAVILSGVAPWSLGMFAMAWLLRAVAAIAVDQALSGRETLAFSCPVWLLPLRDVLSVIVMMASYGGRRVMWRGHGLEADTPGRFAASAPYPFEESNAR